MTISGRTMRGATLLLLVLLVGVAAIGCTDRAAPTAPPTEPPPHEEPPEQVASVGGEWIGAVLVDRPLPAGGRFQALVPRRWFVLQDGVSLLTNFGPGTLEDTTIVVTSHAGEPQLQAQVDTATGLAVGQSHEIIAHPEDWPYSFTLGPWHPTYMLHEGLPAPHPDLSDEWNSTMGSTVTIHHDPVRSTIVISGLAVGGDPVPLHSAVSGRGLFETEGTTFGIGPPQSYWIGGSVRGADRLQLLTCWQLSRFHAGCTASTLTR